jgi:SAM-dependent methyltransferase
MRSLRCALDHYAGRAGRVDLHWRTAEDLPELGAFDIVFAAELLNYVEDPARVLQGLRRSLKPGGHLLLSVEAQWGWAMSLDAPPGTLGAFLGGSAVFVPGDRWVRTFDEPSLRALLVDWEIELLVPTHYVSSGPFELVAGPLDGEELHAAEDALRKHPIAAPLHRAWTVIAR